MAEFLASIFGTEKDRVNCPFYFKTGACTHGERCSRQHNRPTYSQTVLLNHMYRSPVNLSIAPEMQVTIRHYLLPSNLLPGVPVPGYPLPSNLLPGVPVPSYPLPSNLLPGYIATRYLATCYLVT